MGETMRVGILGAGGGGVAHGRGYVQAGGFRVEGVCDLIPARTTAFVKEFAGSREFESIEAMLKDPGIDVVSVCLPTDLHALWAVKALRAGKHVVVESPPALDVKGTRAMVRAAETATGKTTDKSKPGAPRVLLPAFPRHYGGHEMAARQAVEKGYVGTPMTARATWFRPMGVPQGARTLKEASGWYTDPARSGGGALMDLGVHALEVAWGLLGYAKPETVLAVEQRGLTKLGVEEGMTLLVRLEGGKSLELAVAWAVHLPPAQYGVGCRVSGDAGAVEVYTAQGLMLYRGEPGKPKVTALKGPKVTHYPAMMRELKALAGGKVEERMGPARRALGVMQIVEAGYRSVKSGRSVEVKVENRDE